MNPNVNVSQYLYLNPKPFDDPKAEYTLSMAPINSSGDIYHILAYVILAKHYGYTIPSILLTYDKDTTKDQVDRCLSFVKDLGYEDYFADPVQLPAEKSTQPNARQDDLHQYFSKQKENVYYLDQKATTTLIAHHFNTYGRAATSRILRNGFRQRHDDIKDSENIKAVIKKQVDSLLEKLPKQSGNKKLIVLHIRHSGTANKDQDLNPQFIKKFKTYLEEEGDYLVVLIIASGVDPSRYLDDKGLSDSAILPFKNSFYKEHDYGKLIHIEILTRILTLPYLKGIIGNTSGTLDLAAFMGHNVYNIHQFKNGKAAYQDFRLLIQTSFFSAEHFESKNFSGSDVTKPLDVDKVDSLLRNFSLWEQDLEQCHLAPTIDFEEPQSGRGKKRTIDYQIPGYVELLFFKTWKKADDKRNFKDRTLIERTNGDFNVEELPCSHEITKSVTDRYIVRREELVQELTNTLRTNTTASNSRANAISEIVADYVGVALTRK